MQRRETLRGVVCWGVVVNIACCSGDHSMEALGVELHVDFLQAGHAMHDVLCATRHSTWYRKLLEVNVS